jgi:hypothetical protein
MIDLADAFQIVIELARANLAPEELEEERARQIEAIDVLEDFAVNHFGDD